VSQSWHPGDAARVAIPMPKGKAKVYMVTLGQRVPTSKLGKMQRDMITGRGGEWWECHIVGATHRSVTTLIAHSSELRPRGV
jgi:hypothetical protein